MKSRMVILSMLVFGLLLSTAGAGLAVSGGGSNASVIQYGKPTPSNDVLGEQDSGSGTQPGANNGGGGNGPSNAVQPSRQVEAGTTTGSNNLPFTGFAAVPILLGGIVLLSAGLVLRRRTSGER